VLNCGMLWAQRKLMLKVTSMGSTGHSGCSEMWASSRPVIVLALYDNTSGLVGLGIGI